MITQNAIWLPMITPPVIDYPWLHHDYSILTSDYPPGILLPIDYLWITQDYPPGKWLPILHHDYPIFTYCYLHDYPLSEGG